MRTFRSAAERRLPPGQHLTRKFPILSYGETPQVDPDTWDLRVWGLVREETRWDFDEFRALPTVQICADFHCVTTWSRLDNVWEGVPMRLVLDQAEPLSEARFVMFHCADGYTTNLSLEAVVDDDVLLAYRHDGEELTPDHGWPLRAVIPKRYAWKSAKWLRGIELMATDRPGFWEQRGYHHNGDPWNEERHSRSSHASSAR